MNAASAFARKSTAAVLILAAGLLLSACSTASTASVAKPEQKEAAVSYKDLHNLMVRLAQEPVGGPTSGTGASANLTGVLGGADVVAGNP